MQPDDKPNTLFAKLLMFLTGLTLLPLLPILLWIAAGVGAVALLQLHASTVYIAAHLGSSSGEYQYAESLQDPLEQLEWYRKAADQGYARAFVPAGVKYELGGPQQNYAEAMKWYRKAVDSGDGDTAAYMRIGQLYARGLGVKQDNEKAAKWFQMVANRSHAEFLQDSIGKMYEQGDGVKQDYAEACFWFSLSGDADKLKKLATKMTPEQVATAKNHLAAWERAHPTRFIKTKL